MDRLIDFIWWLDRLVLMPILCTPVGTFGTSWKPRGWTKRIRIGRWELWLHPWLWCRCGDALESWETVRRGRCRLCLDLNIEGKG